MRITISHGADSILDCEWADDARFTHFVEHKKSLLGALRKAYKDGPKSKDGPKFKPFDEDKAWRRLIGLARSLVERRRVTQATMPAAVRCERLGEIAKILRRAGHLIERTMQTDVGEDFFSAWWEVAGGELAKPDRSFDPHDMDRNFQQVVKSLAILENAASYPRHHVVPPKRGKPSVLTSDDIWNLAALYRDSTGVTAGAGQGPFVKFVWDVLIAAGLQDDITYDSMVEAVKKTRRWALTDAAARKWGPSPFDEEV